MHNFKKQLRESFSETVETMAFMFCDPLNPEEADYYDDSLMGKITYSGDHKGELSIILPTEMSLEISANALGKNQNEALRMVRATDAVKEILNITIGQFLSKAYGSDHEFNIGIGEVIIPDLSIWDEMKKNEHAVFFLVDDWVVVLMWTGYGNEL